MSLNVLVIPEDFRHDQYILKPIIKRMFREIGKPARVQVCRDPLLGGVDEALKWSNLEAIIDRYQGMVQVFLLIVDRDGQASRRHRLDALEKKAREIVEAPRVFMAENAWQEIEVWVLAGLDLDRRWSWQDLRSESNPKERYYEPHAGSRGVLGQPYQGRKMLGEEAARRYRRIRKLCPEDVAALESRLRELLA